MKAGFSETKLINPPSDSQDIVVKEEGDQKGRRSLQGVNRGGSGTGMPKCAIAMIMQIANMLAQAAHHEAQERLFMMRSAE